MRISRFFIDRPIFAGVVSLVFVILGLVSFGRLPIAQYPEIAPPVVNVTGQYPGASADVVAATVVTPLEQQINGVENMLYVTSNSTGDGRFTIAVTFELGTNLDIAQVQVQNRVAIAQPRLPSDVRNIGVTVAKASPDLMMVVHLYSPDKSRDTLFISNYANIRVIDVLNRINGVGSITVFGGRDYSMRVWLDPDRLQSLGLTTGDVVTALQGQNVQVASGVLSQPPVDQPRAFQVAVQTLGRLADPDQFADIVVKQTATAVVRLKDVARVELAALDYTTNSYLDRDPAVALGIFQLPGSNALATAKAIKTTMDELAKDFPEGLKYTDRLQSDRVHPAVGGRRHRDHRRGGHPGRAGGDPVPADLARRRHPDRRHPGVARSAPSSSWRCSASRSTTSRCSDWCSPSASSSTTPSSWWRTSSATSRPASPRARPRSESMDEVGSALIAIALVLCAVFVPAAFITGISGQFYRQFALTIAGATVISLIVSLTLSPALCALLLKPHTSHAQARWWMRPVHGFFGLFNRGFEALARGYGWLTARIVRFAVLMLRRLRRRHRLRPQRVPQDARRLHPAARCRLSHRRDAAAGRRLARAHRCGQPAGRGDRPAGAGRRPRGELRRLLRRDLHQCAELGGRLPSPRAVRGARARSEEVRRRHPGRPVPALRLDPGGPRHRGDAPAGARHRHLGRLPHDGGGPRRMPGRRRCRAPSTP